MKNLILVIVMAFSTTVQAQWGGWGEDISSNTKNRNEALNMAQVIPGTVIGVRSVKVTPSNSSRMVGGAIGTVAGVVIANQVSNNSSVATAVGGLAGGLLAQGVTPAEDAHEVMVSYFSPSRQKMWTIAITTKEAFRKGERIYLIQDTQGVRIARYK